MSLLCSCAGQRVRPIEDPAARAAVERAEGCKPVFTLEDPDEALRHSCWHRAWEVPAAVVVYPAAAAVALAIILAPIWVPIIVARR